MKFNNRNVHISPSAQIGQNVKIGDNTVIYDNVKIGDNTIICNDCHIGEPLSDYYYNENYINPVTEIGMNCLIRSHSIIYVQNKLGNGIKTGHRIILRNNNKIGNNCSIGNETEIHGHATIKNNVRIHSDVCICEYAQIENFVWIAPGTVLTNDYTPPSSILKGPRIGEYTIIGANVTTLPNIEIGQHCLIGASATITKTVTDYSVMVGNPAKFLCDIRAFKTKDSGSHYYPWPNNFKRGMPWEKIGYKEWLKKRKSND